MSRPDGRMPTKGNLLSIPEIVSVQSSVLPTGASTSVKQDDLLTELQPLTVIYAGTKTVPTGTAEVLASSQAIRSVTIKALSTNTVAVYIGGSGITVSGFELLAGESVSLDVNNLNLVYCISGSASQIIRYIAV